MIKAGNLPFALLCAGCAQAVQPSPAAPAAATTAHPAAPAAATANHSACRSYLSCAYGISEAESRRRIENEQYVGALNTRLHEGALPHFSDLWIQHEPDYAIKVAFTQPPSRAAVLALANPAIRNDIVIVVAKRTSTEIERDQRRITEALQGAPGPWAGGYSPVTGKFEFTVANEAVLDYARRRIPTDILPDVDLKIGPTPVLL